MSLKLKIALGVLAATAVLAVALVMLGLEAKGKLDEAAERHREQSQLAFEEFNRQQHDHAITAIERLILGQLEPLLDTPRLDMPDRLRHEIGGIDHAGIIDRVDDNQLELQVVRPAGSLLRLTDEEEEVVWRVMQSQEHEFLGDILFVPYNPDGRATLNHVLRLQLTMPRVEYQPLPQSQGADLGPLVIAAFTTLAMAMLAVFMLLLFALRRFVLAPLGNVLEDSKRIVKGTEGLEVKGFEGGGNDIETLVAAFNAMFSELKAYQSDLEGKVQTATRTIERQQQSLVIAQRLASTGTLAAGLAHEVNNPLSGMLNAARRLKNREGLDERARDYVELIEEGLQRIEGLMKQILDFSRRRDMKPELFAPESAFKRALPLIRHRLDSGKLRLEEDIRQDLPRVYGNEEEIGQVLMNLMINAIDASPEGGAVRVTMLPTEAGGVEIRVEDSGKGIPADIRERIFDPFFTTKEPGKGTGLGLSIVHTIIGNHNGSIRVEEGKLLGGACFVITLPEAGTSSRKLPVA
jgi:signal transduction histidine kinase